MTNKPNNPPAFPGKQYSITKSPSGDEAAFPLLDASGMSLRDYFAAKAMQGDIAYGTKLTPQERAIWAYVQADAMLEQREK